MNILDKLEMEKLYHELGHDLFFESFHEILDFVYENKGFEYITDWVKKKHDE